MTVSLCGHGGVGHDYPAGVIDAARRLRERHETGSHDDHTSLTVEPSLADLPDVLEVAPYSDLVYATDPRGAVLAEVS